MQCIDGAVCMSSCNHRYTLAIYSAISAARCLQSRRQKATEALAAGAAAHPEAKSSPPCGGYLRRPSEGSMRNLDHRVTCCATRSYFCFTSPTGILSLSDQQGRSKSVAVHAPGCPGVVIHQPKITGAQSWSHIGLGFSISCRPCTVGPGSSSGCFRCGLAGNGGVGARAQGRGG